MRSSAAIWLAVVMVVAIGCGESSSETPPPVIEGDGLARELPAGDAAVGREAFLRLHCDGCHEVTHDPSLPPPEQFPDAMIGPPLGSADRESTIFAILSGVHYPRDDQPDPTVWPPEMGDLSTRMTVADLIDIATYLAGSQDGG